MLCNSGCGLDANNVDGSSNKTVQDYRGKRIVLKNKPKRIISTFYVGDEILYGVADKANVLAYSQWAHDEKISFITEQTKEYTLNPPKVTDALGWYPETKFGVGIVKTIEWYLNNQSWVEEVTSGDYQKYYERMYK